MDEGAALTSSSAASYATTPDMPSRFTPKVSRLSQRAPVKQIALALFLFACGIVMLTIGVCILTGVIDADEYWPGEGWKSMAICFTALGSITFIPGFYVTRIAYYSYKGYAGYNFDQIPQYND